MPVDRTVPSPERQEELRQAYRAESETPYKGVRIGTLGELQWIMRERHWATGWPRPEGTAAPNFSFANLRGIDLSGANLSEANFHGAYLTEANLAGADLTRANLVDVGMIGVNLSGANLTRTFFDPSSSMDDIVVDEYTRFLGARWGGAPLDGVDWSQTMRCGIGDETLIRELRAKKGIRHDQKRIQLRDAYRQAARAYRGLHRELKDQNLIAAASKFRLKGQRMERRANLLDRRFLRWLGSALLDLVSGYGELPGRIFAAYLVVISLFSGIFWLLTYAPQPTSSHLLWYEAIVLSVSSFHGRGFFPQTISLGDPAAVIAVFEAVIGLLIEVILIATFSRRFLGQ